MVGIKVFSCKWLKDKGSENKYILFFGFLKQQEFFVQFFWWFVVKYFMVVFKIFFYIMESGIYCQRVFYYRKLVWRKIYCFGLNVFCGEFFKLLKIKEVEEFFGWLFFLGFFLLRFILKSFIVCFIINMWYCLMIKELINVQKLQLVNWKLQNVFEIFKFEKECNLKSLGFILFGIDDFYRVLKLFVICVCISLEGRFLYFVYVDVKNCYEFILYQKFFDIIK